MVRRSSPAPQFLVNGTSAQVVQDFKSYLKLSRPFVPYLHFGESPFQSKHANLHIDDSGYVFRGLNVKGDASSMKLWVFGGRQVLGLFTEDEATVSERLRLELLPWAQKKGWPDISVKNYAARGYGFWESQLLFQRLLNQGSHPDMVVFLDGGTLKPQMEVPHFFRSHWELQQMGVKVGHYFEPLPLFKLFNEKRKKRLVAGIQHKLDRKYRKEMPWTAERVLKFYSASYLQRQAIAQRFDIESHFFWQPSLGSRCGGEGVRFSDEVRLLIDKGRSPAVFDLNSVCDVVEHPLLTEKDYAPALHGVMANEMAAQIAQGKGGGIAKSL